MSQAIYRYAIFRIDEVWRRLPAEERALHRKEYCDVLGSIENVHVYSLVGLRADADLCLWMIGDDAEELQAAQAKLNATALGGWLRATHSFLAVTRPSQYLKGHAHEGQEQPDLPGPAGKKYLFVYPMDKLRPWYRLPFEERKRMMAEHFKIGHRYPGVVIHTGYSFGIDDQEFVVAFEADTVEEFVNLVQELRGSEASAYTARDVPIFTCVATDAEHALHLLG